MAITLPSYCQKVRMGSTLCQLSFKEEKGEPLRVMLALQATDHYIPHQMSEFAHCTTIIQPGHLLRCLTSHYTATLYFDPANEHSAAYGDD
jgi:hypothetical protein